MYWNTIPETSKTKTRSGTYEGHGGRIGQLTEAMCLTRWEWQFESLLHHVNLEGTLQISCQSIKLGDASMHFFGKTQCQESVSSGTNKLSNGKTRWTPLRGHYCCQDNHHLVSLSSSSVRCQIKNRVSWVFQDFIHFVLAGANVHWYIQDFDIPSGL